MKIRIITIFTTLILLATCSAQLFGQKAKVKEKRFGLDAKQKVKEKRFEPVIKQNLQDYEGTYIGLDSSYVIEVRASGDGKLHVSSLENNQRVTLENLKLEGPHMTATKVYPDGHTEKFDATFSNRILNGVSAFGILVEGFNIKLEGLSFNRIFYRRTAP